MPRFLWPKMTLMSAGGVAVVLVGIVVLSPRTSRPVAGGRNPVPAKPAPNRKPLEGKGAAIQAPKVGQTTTTVSHHGGTTTITKTTIVGSTTTSTLAPTPATPAIPGNASYTIGMSFPSSGSTATAAFAALWTAHKETPPTLAAPIQTAAVPWKSGTTWALVPIGLPDPSAGGPILWFGEFSSSGHWTWIPVDVAGAIPTNLPLPVRQTLQWADDLALDVPGPANLLGPNAWSAVTGQVQLPVGWSIQTQRNAVNVWVWDPSTKYSPLYFAPQGQWSAQNQATGHQALSQIVAGPLPISQAVRDIQAP